MKKLYSIMALCILGAAEIPAESLNPNESIKLALNMYSNQRARQIGDLVVVTVEENSTSVKSEDLTTAKEAKADAEMPFFGYQTQDPTNMFQRFRNSIINNSEQSVPFNEYRIRASSSFTGKGSANSQDKINSEFSCRVVDVLDNGILVIRGDRKIQYRNEVVSLVLTGLIRSRDIDNLNTISSRRVADAHIYYETGGEVSRGSRPGYVWRFFQYMNPF